MAPSEFVSFREFEDHRQETRQAIERLEAENRRGTEALRIELAGGIRAMQSQVDALVKNQKDDQDRRLGHRITMWAAIIGAVVLGVMESATTLAVVFGSRH